MAKFLLCDHARENHAEDDEGSDTPHRHVGQLQEFRDLETDAQSPTSNASVTFIEINEEPSAILREKMEANKHESDHLYLPKLQT